MVKVAIDTTGNEESAGSKPRPVLARRKSRWLLKFTMLMVLLIIAAPSLISFSGQAPVLLKKIHPKLAGAVSFKSVSLHWWAPVELQQLKVRDLSETGELANSGTALLLCKVERVTTVEPLWRIALNAGRGTGIVVKSPRLSLVADERGTNIDRTMTAIFGVSKESDSPRFPFRITIEDGEVKLWSTSTSSILESAFTSAIESEVVSPSNESIVAPVTEVSAIVTAINGTFSTMDTERWLPEMKLAASINKRVSAAVSKRSGSAGTAASRPARLAAGLDDVVSDFPDIPLEDLVGTDESGDATSARIQIHLKPRADEKGRQTIQFGARDVDLQLLQPFLSMLGINVSCDGTISGGIDARLAGADFSEGLVGRLMLQGQDVRIREQSWSSEEWLGLGNVDASGAVAIADDGMLIQDLNIRTDVAELTGSGELRHGRRSNDESAEDGSSQQVEIKGSVDIARLASSLRDTLAIHHDVTIQQGRLTFGLTGSAEATGAIAEITTPQASGAITAAISSTKQLDVIHPAAMSGQTTHHGSWQLVVKTENLAAMRAGKPLNVDPDIRLDAAGRFTDGLPEFSRARLTANFGTIDCSPDKDAWKISGLVQPASLWQQLQQFADLPQPGLRGDLSFQSRVRMQGETVQLSDLQLNSPDIKVSSTALAITPSSPMISMLNGTFHVEGTGAALRTLVSPWHDASWLAEQSHVITEVTATPEREIQLAVSISPEKVVTLQRPGVLSVSRTTGRPVSSAKSTIAPSAFIIDEADVALLMIAREAGRLFDIQNGSIKIPGVVALVNGNVSVAENEVQLDLTADTNYDLDVLSHRLFAPDSGLIFSGQGRDTFRLTGSPSALTGIAHEPAANSPDPAMFKGSGTINWASADVMGLQLGTAAVQAVLENNLLRTEPIQCSMNGGDLNVMPQYDFSSSRLQLGTGSRVQNIQLTPELCRNWLGYVAPMIADSADVSGEVSARVERFLWDSNDPQNSDVTAQLTIHRAQASAGSSLLPLLEIVDLLRRRGESSEPLSDRSLIFPEQTVPIQVRQGYVIHDGLVMELNGYRLTTAGAVGLNKQLQMTIDVPLEKSTAAGSGRSVKVPLRGTVSQPQPDTSALLQNLGTQKIQQKVNEQVDKTLNKQLNKLFDKF